MLRIPFEWLEFAFECFEFLSSGSNLHSNALSKLEIAFECFKSCLKDSNLHLNASNPF